MIQFYSYFHDLSSRKRGSPEETALTITNDGFRQTLTPPAAINHLLTKITGIGGANKRQGVPWRGPHRSGRESRITEDRAGLPGAQTTIRVGCSWYMAHPPASPAVTGQSRSSDVPAIRSGLSVEDVGLSVEDVGGRRGGNTAGDRRLPGLPAVSLESLSRILG